MAINSLTASSDKIPLLSLCSLNSSRGSIIPNRLEKLNFATDSSVTSSIKKSKIIKNINCKSPYLNSDKVHLLSRVTEKRVVQKKAADFVSSFPLAVKIYKANSDEFKAVKHNKRSKKSVLTLPNEQAPVPQTCIVSDMNDSEDFNHEDDCRKKRPKRRSMVPNRRARNDFEFYDRDARYCSQFNINLDCSSTDVIRNFNGDGKQPLKRKKHFIAPKRKLEGKFNGHEVWKVLRNINRFQFRPSPPMSQESIPVSRRKDNQLRFNRKDTRFIETCRTEEFAYISSIEVENKSPTSFSHSSSFDRVTVIDKKDEFSRICEEYEKTLAKTNSVKGSKNQKFTQNKNKSLKQKSCRNSNKVLGSKECNQPAIANNKEVDVTAVYENSGPISSYSSSIVNQVSLPLSSSNDTQQKIHLENQEPERKNHQVQNLKNNSKVEKNIKSSANSVCSKMCLQRSSEGNDKAFESCQEKCNQPLNGITKVVLLKGQGVETNKHLETTKRKSRLATTLTNALIVPKLTQTDIRRRLLNMKFPVVILGKDQVSSTVQVMNYDPPQFDGLDKHVWPFMIEWSDDYKLKVEIEDRSTSKDTLFNVDTKYDKDCIAQKRRYQNIHGDYKSNRTPYKKNEFYGRKPPNNNEKKMATNSKLFLTKKDQIAKIHSLDQISHIEQPKKQKSIGQFKDKMLKFLYKKPQVDKSMANPKITGQCDTSVNIFSENKQLNEIDYPVVINDKIMNTLKNDNATKPALYSSNIKLNDPRTLVFKRPWAKAKWASDFIENVIKKIKNGVYYNQDLKYESHKSSSAAKEVSVQTRLISENLNKKTSFESEIDQPCAQSLMKREDLFKILPGFDNSLPELEVQTLDTDKIEIKNCLTNIIVQFDIIIPRDSDTLGIHTKKSCSLIPLDKNDSNTKLFKCKANIINAMLPAELCSILPDMMQKIVHSDSLMANHSLPINKTDSQLSTISELSHFECFDHLRAISKQYILSQEIREILDGKFSQRNHRTLHKVKSVRFQPIEIVKNFMPDKLSITYVLNSVEDIPKMIGYKSIPSSFIKQEKLCEPQSNFCTNILPYNHKKHSIIPDNQKYNLWNIFEDIWVAYRMFGPLNTSFSMPLCTISFDIPNNGIVDSKTVIINFNNLKFDSAFVNYVKIYDACNALCGKDNLPEKESVPDASLSGINPFKKINHIHGNNHKIKKKCFVKLYKKCKSTSNIPNEKNIFSLSKVTCLDDFFQLFGSKTLSCVFDGNSGKKILSSIVTMKNWITEINSRQALLVLLLANKKDTPNLIRFRPVLLQGIAVNRITRASELDMEIEVIEREKLNGFSQFDGISYLPASTENKDNLLEELQWIAKTTASDYQRPFDESSEKLLKSLLEKRKQLNPSYLRVMARYVGLGLLKSSTKKNIF